MPSFMMKKTLFVRPLLAAVVLAAAPALAADAPKEDAAASSKLLAAVEKADYESFVADGEAGKTTLGKLGVKVKV